MKKLSYIVSTTLLLLFIALSMGCAQHTVKVHGETLTLSYRIPDAHEVFFASSLDNFQYHPATRETGRAWAVTIPLTEEFTYFYIVDGVVTLPECPDTVLDDFGTKNCIYTHGM